MNGFGLVQWLAIACAVFLFSTYGVLSRTHSKVARVLFVLAGLCALAAAFVGNPLVPVVAMIALVVIAAVVHQADRRRERAARPHD
jgi:hypothetical protein